MQAKKQSQLLITAAGNGSAWLPFSHCHGSYSATLASLYVFIDLEASHTQPDTEALHLPICKIEPHVSSYYIICNQIAMASTTTFIP